jgi:hypothetical protein
MSKPEKLTINSADNLSKAIGRMRELFKDKKYFQVTFNTGKKRSIDQNFVVHGWFNTVSIEEKEYTPLQVKCLCKLRIFLPILRAEDEYVNEACKKFIDPLPYESRVAAMEFFPVTSLMSTIQLKRGMEDMQAHYSGRVVLEFDEKGE